jgi:flagellar protein FlaG
MANEMSVHRVSQSLRPFESSVTSNTNLDGNPKGAERVSSADPASPSTGQVTSLSGAELRDAVEHLNQLTRSARRELQFNVDESTGRTVIKVIDSESEEVVREIPPEEVLALIARFENLNNGLVEEKA